MDRFTESADELKSRGKHARKAVPFAELGTFHASDRDVMALLEAQNATRLQELLPLRAERMSRDVFSFYRGTALIMAHDLSKQVSTGLDLVICGDAHISNFGLFASPERKLIFDLNDFDEASTGPWEWDVRRLVTSVVLAARSLNFSDDEVEAVAERAAAAYRVALGEMLDMPAIDRLFTMSDEDSIRDVLSGDAALKIFDSAAKKAKKRTGERASKKLLKHDKHGNYRFVEDPPVLTRAEPESAEFLEQLFEEYLRTVRPDVSLLISTYKLTDIALRVVGVGSVGTRCYLLALTGPNDEQIILQIKEAQPSVITQYHLRDEPSVRVLSLGAPQGQRVVTYQQIMQAASDPFLGHVEGRLHNFYVRQFRDQKGSIEIEGMSVDEFRTYAGGCASLLARVHSQSPMAPAVRSYLGESSEADAALARWSLSYADQAQVDFERYREAISSQPL